MVCTASRGHREERQQLTRYTPGRLSSVNMHKGRQGRTLSPIQRYAEIQD